MGGSMAPLPSGSDHSPPVPGPVQVGPWTLLCPGLSGAAAAWSQQPLHRKAPETRTNDPQAGDPMLPDA